MEIKEMQMSDIEARKAEIRSEIAEATVERLEELNKEADLLEQRRAELQAEIEARAAVVEQVVEQTAEVVEERNLEDLEITKSEEKTMTLAEIRKSEEYVNAYANYIKSENDAECRALLSENATNGTVPVPELVEEIVRTAWEEEGLMALVKKSYLKGNLKVGFEISASAATAHAEGVAVNEETLTLGIVTLIPQAIKKWVSISDEALDLSGAAFLQYIYNEVAHQIAKKAADLLIADIVAKDTTGSSTAPIVGEVTSTTITGDLIAKAIAQLSDQAKEPVIVMNKLTYADFKAAQYSNKYPIDIFEGCKVVFNNSLTAFGSASTGDTYAIVGDFGYGALANFPNGEEITFKFDETTLAHQDLVRVIGREFVGIGVVAPSAFTKILA